MIIIIGKFIIKNNVSTIYFIEYIIINDKLKCTMSASYHEVKKSAAKNKVHRRTGARLLLQRVCEAIQVRGFYP